MRSSELSRLALRAVLFALPLLALWGFLEQRLRTLDNSYSVKRRQFEARLPDLELVATGSSGALNAVDPDQLGVAAYNLANGSQSLHYDVALVSRYLDRLPRLRIVLIAQPYWYMSYELRNAPEAWRQHFYADFWEVPLERPGRQLVTIQRYSYVALYTPMTTLEYALKGFHVALTEDMRESGWQAKSVPDPATHAGGLDARWIKLRVEGHRQTMRAESLAANRAALQDLAARLRARGVKLVLTWVPVAPEYTRVFGPEALAAQRAAIAELEQQAGVLFYDYGSDARLGPQDFYNADHLNAQGAAKWSRILRAEVVQPLLGSKAN
jgi:hypothetical protein